MKRNLANPVSELPAFPVSALGGVLSFEVIMQVPYTDLNAQTRLKEYEKGATLQSDLSESQRALFAYWAEQLAVLLSCTNAIRLLLPEHADSPAILNFMKWWEQYANGPDVAAQFEFCLKLCRHEIMNAWHESFMTCQRVPGVPVYQLPGDALTQAEREELQDPDSPLAVPESPTVNSTDSVPKTTG